MPKIDINRLLTAMIDLERRLQNLQVILWNNQQEINVFVCLKDTLEENIAELKKNGIITLAQVYKKISEDLKKTEQKILSLMSNKALYEKSFQAQTQMLEHITRQYNQEMDRLQNNVIIVDFGKKK